MVEGSIPEYGIIQGTRVLKGYSVVTEEDGEVFHYSKQWIAAVARERIRLDLATRGIDQTLLDWDLTRYRGDDTPGNIPLLQRFLTEFDSRFKSAHLYMWSKYNSTQKTTTAKILAKTLALQGKSVWVLTMGELVQKLKNQDFHEPDADLIRTLSMVDFLVIDDAFDVRKVTLYKSGYQLSFLDTFLRKRLEGNRLSTCFTSNYAVGELTEVFGCSLKALVERNTRQLEFNDHVEGLINVEELWK